MAWQKNMHDHSEEWHSTLTGILWRIDREGANKWFAAFDGVPLRIRSGQIVSLGKRAFWRTPERAREACERHDLQVNCSRDHRDVAIRTFGRATKKRKEKPK